MGGSGPGRLSGSARRPCGRCKGASGANAVGPQYSCTVRTVQYGCTAVLIQYFYGINVPYRRIDL
jgi:hypothetical protein